MEHPLSRTEMILGSDALKRLAEARVIVFGAGGVGGHVVEALARSGVGHLTIVDKDTVDITNLNRQIIATYDTIGRSKVEVCRERILSINPKAEVTCHETFYLPCNADAFDLTKYDYVVDAIDTVAAKIELACRCEGSGIPIIAALGCGNRIDPTRLVVTDIYKTEMDPLAKVMRKELRKRGVQSLTVVCSTEKPMNPRATSAPATDTGQSARGAGEAASDPEISLRPGTPGSTAFVPGAAGLIIASQVVSGIIDYVTSASPTI